MVGWGYGTYFKVLFHIIDLRWYGTPLNIINIWIKIHYNQNTSIVLKFKNFTKKMCFKIFVEKVKILKASAGFEFMTYIFVVNALDNPFRYAVR